MVGDDKLASGPQSSDPRMDAGRKALGDNRPAWAGGEQRPRPATRSGGAGGQVPGASTGSGTGPGPTGRPVGAGPGRAGTGRQTPSWDQPRSYNRAGRGGGSAASGKAGPGKAKPDGAGAGRLSGLAGRALARGRPGNKPGQPGQGPGPGDEQTTAGGGRNESHRRGGASGTSSVAGQAKALAAGGAAEAGARAVQAGTGLPPALTKPVLKFAAKKALPAVSAAVAALVVLTLLVGLTLFGVTITAPVQELGAPAPTSGSAVAASIPAQYISAYEQAAASYGVPWTVLAGLVQVLTKQGRTAPSDMVDYGQLLDRAPALAVAGIGTGQSTGQGASQGGSGAQGPLGPLGGNASSGDLAVRTAEQFLGTMYVWGGDTPATGFDCSGLMQYVYSLLGYQIPRVSQDQQNYGVPVPQGQWQPGDLIFWGDPAGHVAMYAGTVNGTAMMIEAPHPGGVVRMVPVYQYALPGEGLQPVARRIITAAAQVVPGAATSPAPASTAGLWRAYSCDDGQCGWVSSLTSVDALGTLASGPQTGALSAAGTGSGAGTRGTWAAALAGKLGAPSAAATEFIIAWETAARANPDMNNPLALAQVLPGSVPSGRADGARIYQVLPDGLQAAEQAVLGDQNYAGLLAALRAGDSAAASAALSQSPWCAARATTCVNNGAAIASLVQGYQSNQAALSADAGVVVGTTTLSGEPASASGTLPFSNSQPATSSAYSPYHCNHGVCGPWPPMGRYTTEPQGPFQLLPAVVADNQLAGNDIQASANYVASKLASVRDNLVAENRAEYGNWQTNASAADALWTAAVSQLSGTVAVGGPSSGSQCTTVGTGTPVSSEVQEIWQCEIASAGELYVVSSEDVHGPSRTYTTYDQQTAQAVLVSEALAVSAGFSRWGAAACKTKAYLAGVFPLTASQAAAYGDYNRCDPVANIDAAARIVLSVETVPPGARQDNGGPYEPMLGGWVEMPSVFGVQLPELLSSGPGASWTPPQTCNQAITTWLAAIGADQNSPLAPLSQATVQQLAPSIGAYLAAQSGNPRDSQACATASGSPPDQLSWARAVSAQADQLALSVNGYAPALASPVASSAVHVPRTARARGSGKGTKAAAGPAVASNPKVRAGTGKANPGAHSSGAAKKAKVPSAKLALIRAGQAPTAHLAVSMLAQAGPIPGVVAALALYWDYDVANLTGPGFTWGVSSAISRLSLNGSGASYNAGAMPALAPQSSFAQQVVADAIAFGGDYVGDTRGQGVLAEVSVDGGSLLSAVPVSTQLATSAVAPSGDWHVPSTSAFGPCGSPGNTQFSAIGQMTSDFAQLCQAAQLDNVQLVITAATRTNAQETTAYDSSPTTNYPPATATSGGKFVGNDPFERGTAVLVATSSATTTDWLNAVVGCYAQDTNTYTAFGSPMSAANYLAASPPQCHQGAVPVKRAQLYGLVPACQAPGETATEPAVISCQGAMPSGFARQPGLLLLGSTVGANAPGLSGTGKVLSAAQVAALAAKNWPASQLVTAVAVSEAESSFNTTATNNDGALGQDYGLWQVNSYFNADLFSLYNWQWEVPSVNAKMGYKVWLDGTKNPRYGYNGWMAWSTYKSGAYLQFLPAARAAVAAYEASAS